MKRRHAAALALVASIIFSCLTSCATYQVEGMTVKSQAHGHGVMILTYKDGWFAPLGDEGQGISIATEICNERGYSGATTLGQDERCLTHEWQIPYLFAACYETVLTASYYCDEATSAPHLLNTWFQFIPAN